MPPGVGLASVLNAWEACPLIYGEFAVWWNSKAKNKGVELEEFVRETILSVFRAIQDAGTQVTNDPSRRGAVVPLWGGTAHLSDHEQRIDFDVTVTVGSSEQDDIKPTIRVPSLAELSGQMTGRQERSNISRISFSVPVALPGTEVVGTSPRRPAGD